VTCGATYDATEEPSWAGQRPTFVAALGSVGPHSLTCRRRPNGISRESRNTQLVYFMEVSRLESRFGKAAFERKT